MNAPPEKWAERILLALWHGPGYSSIAHGPRSKSGKRARAIIADHIRAAIAEAAK